MAEGNHGQVPDLLQAGRNHGLHHRAAEDRGRDSCRHVLPQVDAKWRRRRHGERPRTLHGQAVRVQDQHREAGVRAPLRHGRRRVRQAVQEESQGVHRRSLDAGGPARPEETQAAEERPLLRRRRGGRHRHASPRRARARGLRRVLDAAEGGARQGAVQREARGGAVRQSRRPGLRGVGRLHGRNARDRLPLDPQGHRKREEVRHPYRGTWLRRGRAVRAAASRCGRDRVQDQRPRISPARVRRDGRVLPDLRRQDQVERLHLRLRPAAELQSRDVGSRTPIPRRRTSAA